MTPFFEQFQYPTGVNLKKYYNDSEIKIHYLRNTFTGEVDDLNLDSIISYMYRLEFKINWIDQTDDLIEIEINIANKNLSARFKCYTSREELREQWQKDRITQVLADKKQTLEMQGSLGGDLTILIEKAESQGHIAMFFDINYLDLKNREQLEKCIIRLVFEPAQLDSFCEQIQKMSGESGETASIE